MGVNGSVFLESELFAAFSRVMPETEAAQMALLCMRPDREGEASELTEDTLILLSLQSDELADRVARAMAHAFLGPGGEMRRARWDSRRATIKAEIDASTDLPTSTDSAS
jgi:hypothetical protein